MLCHNVMFLLFYSLTFVGTFFLFDLESLHNQFSMTFRFSKSQGTVKIMYPLQSNTMIVVLFMSLLIRGDCIFVSFNANNEWPHTASTKLTQFEGFVPNNEEFRWRDCLKERHPLQC
jgi:hypothetical protein